MIKTIAAMLAIIGYLYAEYLINKQQISKDERVKPTPKR